jgi:hypothetical protein
VGDFIAALAPGSYIPTSFSLSLGLAGATRSPPLELLQVVSIDSPKARGIGLRGILLPSLTVAAQFTVRYLQRTDVVDKLEFEPCRDEHGAITEQTHTYSKHEVMLVWKEDEADLPDFAASGSVYVLPAEQVEQLKAKYVLAF